MQLVFLDCIKQVLFSPAAFWQQTADTDPCPVALQLCPFQQPWNPQCHGCLAQTNLQFGLRGGLPVSLMMLSTNFVHLIPEYDLHLFNLLVVA